MTAEELTPEQSVALAGFLTVLAEGKVCPWCKQPITEKKQVGRCVYALPCWHRLYQGTLPLRAKGKDEHPYFREREQGR